MKLKTKINTIRNDLKNIIMFIDSFKFNNDEISVIFTGAKYFFYNQFFGIVAIAERDYNKEINNNAFFTLYFGNSQASENYNNAILLRVKRYIKKEENEIIKKDISFKEVEKDLNLSYLDINAKDRK